MRGDLSYSDTGQLTARSERRAAMNSLYANLASLRRGTRSNNHAAIAMFNKFQAKPLRKATRYDSVASKIAPDIQRRT